VSRPLTRRFEDKKDIKYTVLGRANAAIAALNPTQGIIYVRLSLLTSCFWS